MRDNSKNSFKEQRVEGAGKMDFFRAGFRRHAEHGAAAAALKKRNSCRSPMPAGAFADAQGGT